MSATKDDYPEYRGMSYQQASREAKRLIARDGWFRSWDRLTVLKSIMDSHSEAFVRGRPIDATGWAEAAFDRREKMVWVGCGWMRGPAEWVSDAEARGAEVRYVDG